MLASTSSSNNCHLSSTVHCEKYTQVKEDASRCFLFRGVYPDRLPCLPKGSHVFPTVIFFCNVVFILLHAQIIVYAQRRQNHHLVNNTYEICFKNNPVERGRG